MNAIRNDNFREVEWTDAFNARNIDTKLAWIGASLVMGVDPTGLAEIMLRCSSIELVKRQIVFALDELHLRERRRNGNSTPHTAVGA